MGNHPPPGSVRSIAQFAEKMLSQLTRASRARSVVAAVSRSTQVRSFIAPTVSRRADFVQELYLKELKAYKIPPVKDTAAVNSTAGAALPDWLETEVGEEEAK